MGNWGEVASDCSQWRAIWKSVGVGSCSGGSAYVGGLGERWGLPRSPWGWEKAQSVSRPGVDGVGGKVLAGFGVGGSGVRTPRPNTSSKPFPGLFCHGVAHCVCRFWVLSCIDLLWWHYCGTFCLGTCPRSPSSSPSGTRLRGPTFVHHCA